MEKILSAEELELISKIKNIYNNQSLFSDELNILDLINASKVYSKTLLEKQAEYICKNEMFEFAGSIQLSINQASAEFIKQLK